MRVPALLQEGVLRPFPDPNLADSDGLLAAGGDLSVERLLLAYESGVFPWFNEGDMELWWSPDPRAILEPSTLHVSRSMAKVLRSHRFRTTWNQCFADVMRACAQDRDDGTWILPEMIEAYTRLHERGFAHSVEVWLGEELVGGLYGVHRGGLFAGESMFHSVPNASKVALITAVQDLARCGVELFDVQMMTSHLESMGARAIPRAEYIVRVAGLRDKAVPPPPCES